MQELPTYAKDLTHDAIMATLKPTTEMHIETFLHGMEEVFPALWVTVDHYTRHGMGPFEPSALRRASKAISKLDVMIKMLSAVVECPNPQDGTTEQYRRIEEARLEARIHCESVIEGEVPPS